MDKPKATDETTEQPLDITTGDLTAELLEVLGLTTEATPDEVRAALASLGERAEQSTAIQAELDALKSSMAEADANAAAATTAAEFAALTEGLTLGDKARSMLETLYATDPDGARELMATMQPVPTPTTLEDATTVEPPPTPIHDPSAEVDAGNEADTARKIAERAEQLIAADRKLGYPDAEMKARKQIAKESAA